MTISKTPLFTVHNQTVYEYSLSNDKISVSFINIGASIVSFKDLGKKIDIIVSHDDKKMYLTNPGYLGSITGRHAGRIKDAKFIIDDETYHVPKNFLDKHHLHGGDQGFSFKYFEATLLKNSIKFKATSPHMEAGYPGSIKLEVIYTIKDNELHIEYSATTDKKTILELTNHAYFNLDGSTKEGIKDHLLSINADDYLVIDDELIPLKKASVKNTPFDFRKFKSIGKDLTCDEKQLKTTNGYDTQLIINKKVNEFVHAATLKSNKTNLQLDIFSDQDVLVLYTGNYLDETYQFDNGQKGYPYAAICLESQGIPNSINMKEYKDRDIYTKNTPYKQHTVWKLTECKD